MAAMNEEGTEANKTKVRKIHNRRRSSVAIFTRHQWDSPVEEEIDEDVIKSPGGITWIRTDSSASNLKRKRNSVTKIKKNRQRLSLQFIPDDPDIHDLMSYIAKTKNEKEEDICENFNPLRDDNEDEDNSLSRNKWNLSKSFQESDFEEDNEEASDFNPFLLCSNDLQKETNLLASSSLDDAEEEISIKTKEMKLDNDSSIKTKLCVSTQTPFADCTCPLTNSGPGTTHSLENILPSVNVLTSTMDSPHSQEVNATLLKATHSIVDKNIETDNKTWLPPSPTSSVEDEMENSTKETSTTNIPSATPTCSKFSDENDDKSDGNQLVVNDAQNNKLPTIPQKHDGDLVIRLENIDKELSCTINTDNNLNSNVPNVFAVEESAEKMSDSLNKSPAISNVSCHPSLQSNIPEKNDELVLCLKKIEKDLTKTDEDINIIPRKQQSAVDTSQNLMSTLGSAQLSDTPCNLPEDQPAVKRKVGRPKGSTRKRRSISAGCGNTTKSKKADPEETQVKRIVRPVTLKITLCNYDTGTANTGNEFLYPVGTIFPKYEQKSEDIPVDSMVLQPEENVESPLPLVEQMFPDSGELFKTPPVEDMLTETEETSETCAIENNIPTSEENSENPRETPKRVTRSSTRQVKIRKTLPKQQVRHTPMGLPKPNRLNKKKFSVEEIYLNKNYVTPTEKSWETIFEFPKQEKTGDTVFTEKRKKKRTCQFSVDPSVRKPLDKRKKARKKIKFFPKKVLKRTDLDDVLESKLNDLKLSLNFI